VTDCDLKQSFKCVTIGKIIANVCFGVTVCKKLRPMLSDRCPVCLSVCPICPVCNVGVLWPNGWMDQDETWLECSAVTLPRRETR